MIFHDPFKVVHLHPCERKTLNIGYLHSALCSDTGNYLTQFQLIPLVKTNIVALVNNELYIFSTLQLLLNVVLIILWGLIMKVSCKHCSLTSAFPVGHCCCQCLCSVHIQHQYFFDGFVSPVIIQLHYWLVLQTTNKQTNKDKLGTTLIAAFVILVHQCHCAYLCYIVLMFVLMLWFFMSNYILP